VHESLVDVVRVTDADVVDEHVDAPELGERALDQLARSVRRRQIDGQGHRVRVGEGRRDGARAGDDVHAFLEQDLNGGQPDALAPAGDDGGLP
jgi:hypothetical protein